MNMNTYFDVLSENWDIQVLDRHEEDLQVLNRHEEDLRVLNRHEEYLEY